MQGIQGEPEKKTESGVTFIKPFPRPPSPTSRKRTSSNMEISLGGGIPPAPSGDISPPQDPRLPIPIPDKVELNLGMNPLALASLKFRETRDLAERALSLVRFAEELKDAQERTEREIKVLESGNPELKSLIQGARALFTKKRAVPKIRTLPLEAVDPKRAKTTVSTSTSTSSSSSSSETKLSKSKKKRDKAKAKKGEGNLPSSNSTSSSSGLVVKTQDLPESEQS